MKLSQKSDDGIAELTQDLMALSSNSNQRSQREAGGGTVQGGGFRR
jgi:hypothetical protein